VKRSVGDAAFSAKRTDPLLVDQIGANQPLFCV